MTKLLNGTNMEYQREFHLKDRPSCFDRATGLLTLTMDVNLL